MYVIDPDTDLPIEEAQASPADAAAEPTAEEVFSAAMDKGVEEATPEAAPAADEAKPEAVPGAEPTQAEKDAAAVEAAKVEPNKEVEAEIAGLGLKEKAAERFRDMAGQIRDLAPIKAQLEAAGIKDVAEIPVLARRAKDGDDLVSMVTETGCTADDFTRVLDYMGTITKGRSGDRAAVEAAFKTVGEEYAAIAKALGKEIPGVHDPLADHADLLTAIEDGDMTRKAALEVVQARTSAAAQAARQAETQQHERAQQSQQQAIQQGLSALQAWEQPKLTDPAYTAIRPALNAKVSEIRQQFPPAQWAAVTDLAYQALAAEARAAIPAPKPPIGPMRPGGPRPAMAPAVFDDPYAAMDAAIAETDG